MSENETFRTLKRKGVLDDCPFCGHKLDADDQDVIYPSGLGYFNTENGREYVFTCHNVDGICYKVVCNEGSGGCGATIFGDSKNDAIRRWNRRYA